MNKTELVEEISKTTDLSQAKALEVLNAAVAAIQDSLSKGEAVTLVGFGSFIVRERAARKGRSPKTGETIEIKASKTAAFKPGKALKDAMND